MQTYRVKLLEGHSANPNNISGGYLSLNPRTKPALYTRGQALKKANRFGGKIEKFGKNITTNPLKMLQLAESEIHPTIVSLMKEKMVYEHYVSLVCFITYGNVFAEILEDQAKGVVSALEQEILDELEVLDCLSMYHEYIQVI